MNFLIRDPQPDTLEEIEEPETPIITGPRKLCPCGKMFTPYRSFQRYHNDACRVKYEAKRPSRYVKKVVVTKTCPQCGKEFESSDDKKVYCTSTCYLAHEATRHVDPEERVCLVCGAKFTTTHWSKRYCSAECRREARRQ
jgi:RNA polymerase subunit RPABC4/transcription elongation factor Spt4